MCFLITRPLVHRQSVNGPEGLHTLVTIQNYDIESRYEISSNCYLDRPKILKSY